MQRALRHYVTDTVEEAAVAVRGDRYVVELGDGERMQPPDGRVAALAKRMHGSVAPLTPSAIYQYANGDDWDHDALGRSLVEEDCDSPPHSPVTQGGDAQDVRFAIAKLSHVATPLVQRHALDRASPTFGHPITSYDFETPERARLAVAVDRRHRRASAEDVLRCLSRALDAPLLKTGITQGDKLVLRTTEWEPRDEATLEAHTSQWTALVQAVRRKAEDGGATTLWAFYERTSAARVTVVHHHWDVENDSCQRLVHRVLSQCELRFCPQALGGGGFVQLRCAQLHDAQWPWWVAKNTRHVDALVTRHAFADERVRPTPTPPTLDERGQRDVVQDWKRHERAVLAPYLLDVVSLDFDSVLHGRGLVARRVADDATRAADAHAIFAEEWGTDYASNALSRCASHVYAVYENDNACVAAFAVVVYACVFDDGLCGAALMVDSFAVASHKRGGGVGTRAYLLCRDLAARHAGAHPHRRHAVFAQCVRHGKGKKFWERRLDACSAAGALLLQALALDKDRVVVQLRTVCDPRAREYCV